MSERKSVGKLFCIVIDGNVLFATHPTCRNGDDFSDFVFNILAHHTKVNEKEGGSIEVEIPPSDEIIYQLYQNGVNFIDIPKVYIPSNES